MGCVLRIGLTGGIGSGKSEASRQFERLGASVIDTDLIARELVEPGQPALAEIAAIFGNDILDDSGRLDRARLRQRVFSDPVQREKLEAILHPRIRDRAIEMTEQSASPYCVLVIPLLFETASDYPLDRILVIDAPVDIRSQRVKQRDGLSDSEIGAILQSQASRHQRLNTADDVVENQGSLEDLKAEIERLHHFYLNLCSFQRG